MALLPKTFIFVSCCFLEVNQFNSNVVKAFNKPINLDAKHIGIYAEVDRLYAQLYLCARVILTENLWTENALVNGSLSTVGDLVWRIDSDNL